MTKTRYPLKTARCQLCREITMIQKPKAWRGHCQRCRHLIWEWNKVATSSTDEQLADLVRDSELKARYLTSLLERRIAL